MIAYKIRELRLARRLTAPQLARKARIPRGHLFHIENKNSAPGVATLERIAEALNVGLGRLLAISRDEIILEDPFVREVTPYLRALNHGQREHVLRVLAAAPKTFQK